MRANTGYEPYLTFAKKDDETFQIDNLDTIRIVQYDQYFVSFFSKNPEYVQVLELAKLLLNDPNEFIKRFNDVLKGVSNTSAHEQPTLRIHSLIEEILTIYRTELHEKINIKRKVYNETLDDRGKVSIKVELSFVNEGGREITRIINIIQQTEGFFANVPKEVLYSKSNNQLSAETREISAPLKIVIPTDTYASGNDGQTWYGAGGILSICNSDSVDLTDQEITEKLRQYKLNRLSIVSDVQKEGSTFKIKHLELKRIPTGKEDNHVLPVSNLFKCLEGFFTASEDFFSGVEDSFFIFSRVKQSLRYSNYIEASYKKLKNKRDQKTLSKEKLVMFLERKLIPYIFLMWNQRDTSVYSQLKTQQEFGREGVKVRLINKSFKNLLNNTPSDLDKFQKEIEKIRDKFFGVLDIPTIVKIDPKKLDQYSKNISKYLMPRINAMLDYPSTMVASYFLEQIENSLISASDEAMSAFYNVQEFITKPFTKTVCDSILKECEKIKECCKDQQVQQHLEKFKTTQEFKYQLKQFSNNIIEYNEEYDLLQQLNKIMGSCQDGKIKSDLSVLKSNLTVILKVQKSISEETQDTKVNGDTNKLESYLAAILLVLKNLGNKVDSTQIIDNINTIAKKDLDTIIYDVRKLFQAWIYILELKKPHDYYKKDDYKQFLSSFFKKQEFLQKLIDSKTNIKDSKTNIKDRLNELKKMILKEVDNQSELSFDYDIQASIIGRPGSSAHNVHDVDVHVHDVSKIITDNLREGYDIYNEFFIRIVLLRNTKREFRVFIGTANEERELITEASVKSEIQYASDYLVIIKGDKGNFIKYTENGGEFKDYPDCKHNDDFINIIIYNINDGRNTRTFPIAIIGSPSSPISQDKELAMVQKLSPYDVPFIHHVGKHYLTFHKEIEGSKEGLYSCIYKCNSVLKKPFGNLYNKYFSSRDISEKLISDSEHDNASKSDNINVDSCLDNSSQNIAEVADVQRNLNVNCGTSDDHLKQQENNFEHLDDVVGLNDSKDTDILIRIDFSNEKPLSDKSETSSQHENTDEKSTNEDTTSSSGIKRSRTSDGSTQKPSEKKVMLDDSLRKNVDAEESVGDYQKGDEAYRQQDPNRESNSGESDSRSNSADSQEEKQPTLIAEEDGVFVNFRLNFAILSALNSNPIKWDMVRFLIGKRGNVNIGREIDNNTCLHCAVLDDNLDMVEFLVEKGAIINAINNNNITPLDLARERGVQEIIEFLQNAGQLLNKNCEQQDSDQKSGSEANNSQSDSIGSQEGKQPTSSEKEEGSGDELSVHNSSEQNSSSSLEQDNDINDESSSALNSSSPESLYGLQNNIINSFLGNSGGTILHLFTRINHYRAIGDLINSGVDVNAMDSTGYTALHLAAKYSYYDIVFTLMHKGADVNARDFSGRTPLEIAENLNDENPSCYKCIKYLKNHDPEEVSNSSSDKDDYNGLQEFVNFKYDNDETSLHIAVKNDNDDAKDLSILIAIGADVNIKSTKYEYTPLHHAAIHGKIEAANTLIQAGADPDAELKCSKWTPLHFAVKNGAAKVVSALIQAEANIDAKTASYSYTPLHFAVLDDDLDMLLLLIQGGANVCALSIDKCTPLSLAKEQKKWEITKILKEEIAKLCHSYPDILEILQPETTLSSVTLGNQLRRRSAPF